MCGSDMSGYRIEDVPSIDLDDGQVEILSTHDEQQAALMAEALIRVDERDNVIGPVLQKNLLHLKRSGQKQLLKIENYS